MISKNCVQVFFLVFVAICTLFGKIVVRTKLHEIFITLSELIFANKKNQELRVDKFLRMRDFSKVCKINLRE